MDHGTGITANPVGGSDFDLRVTIAVGMLRFLLDYQRSEIQVLMESRGIGMSTGEISNLTREFLLRFYCSHRKHMKDLDLGEYLLHLDGTGEAGDDIVFMAKDGITGITMDARIMPSESSEYIIPFLQEMKGAFGDPVAMIRDMGPAIKESVSVVFPGILQLICHYHFVKDLGKDAFGTYEEMRAAMVSTKALARVSSVTVPDRDIGIRYAEELWTAIASEYILHSRNIPSKYPFVLPYCEVLERCIEVAAMLKSIIGWNASHMMAVKQIMNLQAAVVKITHDHQVMEKYRIMARTWAWFESVRKALGVFREMSSSGSGKDPADMDSMGRDLNAAISAIREEAEFTGGELERIYGIFRNRIEDHRAELLSPVRGKDGNVINVVRHNGIEEIGHRWSRMHIRRRTGRSKTSREMAMYGALTAILSNMENDHYLKHVLSRIDFLKEFSSVTKDELDERRNS